MKILSIDVGIKNLAICLFNKSPLDEHFKITKWDVVNLLEEESLKCEIIEKNIMCNKPAKFKKDNKCYCLKHSKKQQYEIPTSEHKPSIINKHKIIKLYEIADSYNIKYDKKIKKNELTNLINDHIYKTYFATIERKKANELDLFNVGVNIKNKFNYLFKDEGKIDYVIIENQIGPLAIRMKTIQGMIVQYFIMSHLNVDYIEFISAANKLKDCNIIDKEKYSDRKKLGINKCLEILTSDFRFNEHINYFNLHKKKDDLSDSFLQGLWFINNKKL
jgi:Mitochondrial resolvase Ydc2 / RNA splicing MRS1